MVWPVIGWNNVNIAIRCTTIQQRDKLVVVVHFFCIRLFKSTLHSNQCTTKICYPNNGSNEGINRMTCTTTTAQNVFKLGWCCT